MEKDYLQGEKINTLYFGGGTPSLLQAGEINTLIMAIRRNYSLDAGAEITLESNPDDITPEKIQSWKDAGINRLSIGVQSFFDEELRWMNRAHTAAQALETLYLAQQQFDNITMDLIYGSPLLTDEMWQQNVEQALALDIPHLSCYALTVEEKTPLHKNILQQRSAPVDPEKQARQFLLLMEWLRRAGYEHYEVSNFARPGYRSRHNSSYWQGKKYLGLGPSAHSYNGVERRWNVANNAAYTRGIEKHTPEREQELLTETEKLNEMIMISLRTKEGMYPSRMAAIFGEEKINALFRKAEKYCGSGWAFYQNGNLRLTEEGFLHADGIAADLFF